MPKAVSLSPTNTLFESSISFGVNLYNKLLPPSPKNFITSIFGKSSTAKLLKKEVSVFLKSLGESGICIKTEQNQFLLNTPSAAQFTPLRNKNGCFIGGDFLIFSDLLKSEDLKRTQCFCQMLAQEISRATCILHTPDKMREIALRNNISLDDMNSIISFTNDFINSDLFYLTCRFAFAYVFIDLVNKENFLLVDTYQKDIDLYGMPFPKESFGCSITPKVELALTNFSLLKKHTAPRFLKKTANIIMIKEEILTLFFNICLNYSYKMTYFIESKLRALRDYFIYKLNLEAEAYSVSSHINKQLQGIKKEDETINDVIPIFYRTIANVLEKISITVKENKILSLTYLYNTEPSI